MVLEREAESTLTFAEGANRAYAGHMTLKFSPDATSTMQHHKHYCLEVSDNCSPTVDHCIIRSASVGEFEMHINIIALRSLIVISGSFMFNVVF